MIICLIKHIVRILFLVIILGGIGINTIYGQRVSRCEDLGLDPVEPDSGTRLLAIYLEGDADGLGGHGC